MKLVWTLPAHEDRKSIREYIAFDNPSAASILMNCYLNGLRACWIILVLDVQAD